MTATSSSSPDPALTAARALPTTAAELLALAARHDLHLLADDAHVDTTGLDFLVVHARDAAGTWWIVRTPRRPDVYASSQVEARVLALVGPRLPVAVPEWRVHSPELIAYPRIAGTPAVTVTPEGKVTKSRVAVVALWQVAHSTVEPTGAGWSTMPTSLPSSPM